MHDPLLFANRYRIPSTRKPSWNYAKPGRYFIMISTNDRIARDQHVMERIHQYIIDNPSKWGIDG